MFFHTANRLYAYTKFIYNNPEFLDRFVNRFVEFYKEGCYRHIFLIMDITPDSFNILMSRLLPVMVNNFNIHTKLHFIGMRNGMISKQTTKQFKRRLREFCLDCSIPKSHYCIETSKNFYILMDNGITYRITEIPNTHISDYVICSRVGDTEPLLRIAGVEEESIVDGIGIRYVVFVQGCPHHCEGCHNPGTWDYDKGYFITISKLVKNIIQNPMLSGVTFSGGEPFMQAEALYLLLIQLKQHYEKQNKTFNFTTYTGFKLSELLKQTIPKISKHGKTYSEQKAIFINGLLSNIDYLVDGKFEMNNKSMNCKFRGSTNQKMYEVTHKNGENSFQEIFPPSRNN